MLFSGIVLAVAIMAVSGQGGSRGVSSPKACDLSGAYRFRFSSNGDEGWWFRFKVEGKRPSAMLLEDVEVLALESGPLDLAIDGASCRFAMRARTMAVGQLSLNIDLDPTANVFTGTMTRTRALRETERHLAIIGVRESLDRRETTSCVVPGIYQIDFDAKSRWRNPGKGDNRSCRRPSEWLRSVVVRVERFGKEIAMTKVEETARYKQTFASGNVEQLGECSAKLKIDRAELSLDATLSFRRDGVTGTAEEVRQQVFEDEGNIWDCAAGNIPLSIKRVH